MGVRSSHGKYILITLSNVSSLTQGAGISLGYQAAYLKSLRGRNDEKSSSTGSGATINHWFYTYKFRVVPLFWGTSNIMSPLIKCYQCSIGLERFQTGESTQSNLRYWERKGFSLSCGGLPAEGLPSPHPGSVPSRPESRYLVSSCGGSKEHWNWLLSFSWASVPPGALGTRYSKEARSATVYSHCKAPDSQYSSVMSLKAPRSSLSYWGS